MSNGLRVWGFGVSGLELGVQDLGGSPDAPG